MSERPVELQAVLTEVRRRWTLRSVLRAATLGAAAAAVAVLTGWGATLLVAREGIPLLIVSTIVLLIAAFACAAALWQTRRRPTDNQLARLVEERDGGLDDVLATAVEYSTRPDASPRMREALFADAVRALSARELSADLDRVISRRSVRSAAFGAFAAALALALVCTAFAPSVSRAGKVASAYLFPARLTVEVTPGSTKVRAGQPVTITARISGLEGEVVPTLVVSAGDQTRNVRMLPGDAAGTFQITVEKVTSSFSYSVAAAKARSDRYTVTMIRPPRVERIDVHYEFPKDLGLEPRTDEDSGDIYGPAGTRVRLSIAADKPIASAFLLLGDGTKVPLAANAQALDGGLTIEEDGSYRIAMADEDGLESPGDTEYFIRTLDDQPPDVRIVRPASDKQVSPLEEVLIEARADDDFGVASLDVVFQTPDGKQRAVPLKGMRGGLTAAGLHMLFMEDLKVRPGDFVTYYARARDVSRGRRSSEARSDIFFLEVKPFEEEFVMAQSQSGQGGMQGGGLEGLVDAQKQIIVATWNLDARARRARGAQSQQDIKAVGKAQSELRDRAEQASAQSARMTDPRMRRRTGGPAPGEDPIGKAVEAMGRAVAELDKLSTAAAMPHEMEALNQLLKANADDRRRQITRSQQAGGGGGQNRAEADLSSLFDQELRKRQTTNYETPNSTESRQDTTQKDPLDQIRELARRQDALNREQRELAKNREQLEAEELKRRLERLTREQNELRQQAQQLAQQMQNGQQGNRGGQGQQDESRRMRDVSEDMRNAATGLQRQDPDQASQSGTRASERLRDLEREIQTARPDERRRALGDLQLESRQLADEQRRLAGEAGRTTKGQTGDDARRRLAADQERLADRTEQLQENVKRMSRGGQGESDERRATEDAARELEKQNVASRMRQAADALRQGTERRTEQEDVAKALDRVAEQLGTASGAQDANARRQSDQLARTQELRDKLQGIDRNLEQLQRDGQQGQNQGQQSQGKQSGQPQQGQAQQGQQGQAQQSPGQQSQGQHAQRGQQGQSQQGEGQQAGSNGGRGGRLEELQREVNEQMRDAERLAESLRRDNPGMQANPDASWWRSFSAPGTEAFKQDFARWESLKKNLLLALEDVETKAAGELRARESDQRLNAGGHETVSDAYRELVDKYYRSLAAPRRPQQ
jgi:hypothetical protein